MAFFIGRDREARRAYGLDEIALVPGDVTVNPEEVDTSLSIGKVKLEIPFLASAMDGVVDTQFAGAGPEESTKLVQELYRKPVKDDLIAERVHEIKKSKVPCAVSSIPQ